MSGFGAIKGNGVKIPAFNQYRGHRETHSLAKVSHWGNLRRQNVLSFEVRVGRTAVVDGIFAKNGYGDVLPILGMTAITFFIFIRTTQYVFPWPDIAQVEYPAEQENGVRVPTLPAL